MAKPPHDPSPNAAQLSGDINSGRSGDKVAGFDPAAAPLGTDEEAGGHSPSSAEIAQARQLENRDGVSGHKANGSEPAMTPDGVVSRWPGGLIWAVGLVALLVAAVVIAAVMGMT
ncbi:MAG TPA: hypothetical protein VEA15_03445 [Caulobacteraceae bacterium]|nr:hypothetical protein [Caulobacteraceae bacterium]